MLKCDFANLRRETELLEAAGAELLHLDVMDGHFVPNLSYGPVVIERLREVTTLPFDAHLMISDPARYVDDFLAAGCDAITFHIEAVPEPRPLLETIRQRGALAGLSVNPRTPVSAIERFLPACDLVLIMSVQPGFGGQAFQPAAVDKVRQVREQADPGTLLSIDGGIGRETIPQCAGVGIDLFVVGSAIFESNDYRSAIDELRSLAAAQTR
jgi:ribulose-phosphate 3-epimerase